MRGQVEGGHKGNFGELLGVMEMAEMVILPVEVMTKIYTYVKFIKRYTFEMGEIHCTYTIMPPKQEPS